MNRRTLAGDHRRLAQMLRPGLSVLDVGCGSGVITADIARAVQPHGLVVGIDREPWHIEQAREQFTGQPGLRFQCNDILVFDGKARFDIVSACRSLQWIPQVGRALARMVAAVKPGGAVVVLDFNHHGLSLEPKPPAAVTRFLQAFLAWRDQAGMDNALADHLSDRFAEVGLTNVQISNQDEIVRRGDATFDVALELWAQVIVICGPRIVAAGLLTEDDCVTAYADYDTWCRDEAQSMHLVLRAVEGTRPAAPPCEPEPASVAALGPITVKTAPTAPTDRRTLANDVIAILSDLIAIPSVTPPGDTSPVAAYAAGRLRRAGYRTEVLSRRNTLENVVARLGRGHPNLVFNTRADTAPAADLALWSGDPFRPVITERRVMGLGVANAKASLAVQLWLAEEIARRGGPVAGEVVFTVTADAEVLGRDGSLFLRESGVIRPDRLILGAPTGNRAVITEGGVLWARLTTSGQTADAGDAAAGDSAIQRMVRLINRIDRELVPKLASRRHGVLGSTLTIGRIEGGESIRLVPASCSIEIDRRLPPDETVDVAFAELLAVIEGASEPRGTVVLEYLHGSNGYVGRSDGPLMTALGEAVATVTGIPLAFFDTTAVTDGRYFADGSIEVAAFGPGSADQVGAPNEWVAIADLVDAARSQLGMVERLMGLAGGPAGS